MEPAAETLFSTFVAAYRPHVEARLAELEVTAPPAVLEDGRRRLAAELRDLLSRPWAEQRRSPLEVFRGALRPVTEALAARGVPRPERDAGRRALLPEDPYGLSPGSSAELGEEAWRAHLAWGAAKAVRVTSGAEQPAPSRPIVALVTVDLLDRSRIEPAVVAAGYALAVVRDRAAGEALLRASRPVLAIVDLTHSGADEAIAGFAAAGIRVIAYGPHVDDVAMARARTLGAAATAARSRFLTDPGRWLPRIA